MVPREHWGQARALRNRLRASTQEFSAQSLAITEPLMAGWKRARLYKLPDVRLRAAARLWRERLPAFGRIGEPRIEFGRHSLALAEFRILDSTQRDSIRDAGTIEHAIAVTLVTAIINRKRFHRDAKAVATLSLHALARRFERGDDPSDEAVLADISQIVREPRRPEQGEYRIPVPDGGSWVGERVRAGQELDPKASAAPVIFIRTYLDGAHWLRRRAAYTNPPTD